MLYLLWSLINIALLVFFIATCFKATKLVREKIGLFASVIFVFGLLSFTSSNNNGNTTELKRWTFNLNNCTVKTPSSFTNVVLENNLISKYELGIRYEKNNQLNIPISAFSSTEGITSGTNWKPVFVNVERTNDNNKFQYFVTGTVEWKLFGLTFYSQPKTYKGFVYADPFKN
jgi:hypothetical protein